MSDDNTKITMTFEQACRLAFRSVEIGNTENALAIMAKIEGRIDEIVAERNMLRAEVARLAAERDKLIDACIAETPHENDHAWSWGLRARGGFERTRADAVAAVRKAAGLED